MWADASYSVVERIQTYTEAVPLKQGKLAAKYIGGGYADILYSVVVVRVQWDNE